MESSDDWCIFKKIGLKPLENFPLDLHSSELISVNNSLGYIFIAEISILRILRSSDILSYFESSSPSILIDFSIPITKVVSDKLGKTTVMVFQNSLICFSFQDLIQGKKSEVFNKTYESLILKIEWMKERFSVLTSNHQLELFNQFKLIGSRPNVQSFTFVAYSKGVVSSGQSLLLVSLPDFSVQSRCESNFYPIGLHFFSNKILKVCIENDHPYLKIYSMDLKEIQEIDCLDSFPYSPQEMLKCDLTALPIVSFVEYLKSRDTLLVSSTIFASLDVVMNTGEYSKVNFEENMEGQCKIGWVNGKECVFRGFGLVTNYGNQNEKYEYFMKDTSYSLAMPPLVVYIGNKGELELSRLLDLRREYLDDKICQSFNDSQKMVQEDDAGEERKSTGESFKGKAGEKEEIKGNEGAGMSETKKGFTEYLANPGNPFLAGKQDSLKRIGEGLDKGESLANPFLAGKQDSLKSIGEGLDKGESLANPFLAGKQDSLKSKGEGLDKGDSLANPFLKTNLSPALADPNLKPGEADANKPKSGFFVNALESKPENFNISGPLLSSQSLFSKPLPVQLTDPVLKPSDAAQSLEKPSLFPTFPLSTTPFSTSSTSPLFLAQSQTLKPSDAPFIKDQLVPKSNEPSLKLSENLQSKSLTSNPPETSLSSLPSSKPSESHLLSAPLAKPLENPPVKVLQNPSDFFKSSSPFESTSEKPQTAPNTFLNPIESIPKAMSPLKPSENDKNEAGLISKPLSGTLPSALNATEESQNKAFSFFNRPDSNQGSLGTSLFNKPPDSDLVNKTGKILNGFSLSNEAAPKAPESLFPAMNKTQSILTQPLNSRFAPEETKSKPEESIKVTTVSSQKIQEQDEIFRLFRSEMENILSSIELLSLESKLKHLDTIAKSFQNSLNTLKQKYLENTEKTNGLYRNLDEVDYGIQYITQIWRHHQNAGSSDESLDLNLIKSVDKIEKSVKTLSFHLENGIDKVVDSIKSLNQCLGIINKADQQMNSWKKTRSFSQSKPSECEFNLGEMKSFIKYKIESLQTQLENTEQKCNVLNKSFRKKQQKVYRFDVEEDDDDDAEKERNDHSYVDPSEYTKLFKNFSKANHRK